MIASLTSSYLTLRKAAVSTVVAGCFVAAALPLPAVAETEEERATRCAGQAAIAVKAIDLRLGEASKRDAAKQLAEDDTIAGGPYEAHVTPLVEWVYMLPEGQVTPLAAEALEMACNQFDG